jgi:hypothetical protein
LRLKDTVQVKVPPAEVMGIEEEALEQSPENIGVEKSDALIPPVLNCSTAVSPAQAELNATT